MNVQNMVMDAVWPIDKMQNLQSDDLLSGSQTNLSICWVPCAQLYSADVEV